MSEIKNIDSYLRDFSEINFTSVGKEAVSDAKNFPAAEVISDASKATSLAGAPDLSSRVVEVIPEQPPVNTVASISGKTQPSSSIWQKMKTVAFYTFAAAASAVVVGLLVSQGLSSAYRGIAFQEGQKLKDEIDNLRRSGDPHWREKAIALIERARKDSPGEDLSRLRGAGVLDWKTEEKLDKALNGTEILSSTPLSVIWHGQPHVKKLYGQALEIKKLYQDTFDVFLHAQASPWLPVSDLVKELWSSKLSQDDFRHFAPLRAPCSTASPGFMETTCRTLDAINPFAATGVGQFRDRWFQLFTLSDSDAKVREELLSVDGYFFNNYRYESSMFFLRNNDNILTRSSKIEEVAQKAIRHFEPSVSEGRAKYLARKVARTNPSDYPCGNLFVFCIPKEQSPEVQYRAHPFGRACQCHPREEDRRILDKLQKGQFDASTQCNSALLPTSLPPQFRLYLPEVQPKTGKKVFLLTPLAAAERKKMQESIHEIAGQVSPVQTGDTMISA